MKNEPTTLPSVTEDITHRKTHTIPKKSCGACEIGLQISSSGQSQCRIEMDGGFLASFKILHGFSSTTWCSCPIRSSPYILLLAKLAKCIIAFGHRMINY